MAANVMVIGQVLPVFKVQLKLRSFPSPPSKQSKSALCEENQLSGYEKNSESYFAVLNEAQMRNCNVYSDVSYSIVKLK